MEKNKNYHDEQNNINTLKMREVLTTLPPFCKQFFRGIQDYTSSRTRLAYAYDLRVFFEFMHENNPYCNKMDITDLPLSVLDYISREDIEEYMDYLSLYTKEGKEITNDERGKKRKLSALKSFYNYYYTSELIKTNPAALVPLPKLHEKPILRLEADEMQKMLDTVLTGEGLTDRQQKLLKFTGTRDKALLLLFLGTGIRVSECVGLNLSDIDLELKAFVVTRKGGDQSILYFPDQVANALQEYLQERQQIVPLEGHEEALFLSLQKRRITQRAVQNLVKKYAQIAAPLKKRISPHKLRSTFGTNLYQETGDIYLVADVLGHSDVNTTRKHYAAMTDAHKREAARRIMLPETEQKKD